MKEDIVVKDEQWIKEKPDFACIFVGKKNGEYITNSFFWTVGEDKNGEAAAYLAWLDQFGSEWDDYDECDFDEYLILKILSTEEEMWEEYYKQLNAE